MSQTADSLLNLETRISEVLDTLRVFAETDSRARIKHDLSADDPLAELFAGVNEVLDSLESARRETLAQQKELENKLMTIAQQRRAIEELSTPLIEIWDGVLCMPIVGLVDTIRSAEMTEALLKTVVEKRPRFTIIDITGIEVMDTGTADHFIRMAKSVRLLGSRCALSGMKPAIAQTLVHIGVDLGSLETHRTLRDALQSYVEKLPNGTRPRA